MRGNKRILEVVFMKIVFWGTPELAVPILNDLYNSSHSILAVVTQPDRYQGKHHKQIAFSPVKSFAVEKQISVLQPESPKEPEFFNQLQQLGADIMVVAAYGEIIPKRILELPPYSFVNVHFSLLPKYRGASPIVSAILSGDAEIGISIMKVVSKLDAGPVFGEKRIPILSTDTKGILEKKLSMMAGSYLLEIMEQIFHHNLQPQEQDESKVSFCKTIVKENGEISWLSSAIQIERQIRAMNPWPMCYSTLFTKGKGIYLIVHKAEVVEMVSTEQPGKIINVNDTGIDVATGQGVLRILQLQRSGKNPLFVKEFLRGTPVQIGDFFEPGKC